MDRIGGGVIRVEHIEKIRSEQNEKSRLEQAAHNNQSGADWSNQWYIEDT